MHLECFGLDCMKRHKRNQLVRDIWRLAASGDSAGRPTPPPSSMHSINSLDMKIKSTLNSLLKRLDVDELETLLESVKSKGRAHTPCVHLPPFFHLDSNSSRCSDTGICTEYTSDINLQAPACTPCLGNREDVSWVVCRALRWPNLLHVDPLKQMPNCQIPAVVDGTPSGGGTEYDRKSHLLCVNPYHWCRVSDISTGRSVCSST